MQQKSTEEKLMTGKCSRLSTRILHTEDKNTPSHERMGIIISQEKRSNQRVA
jgi:hypothetical protein